MIPNIDPYITQAQNDFMKVIMNSNLNPVHHFPYFTHTSYTPSIPMLPFTYPNYPIMSPIPCPVSYHIAQMSNYNTRNIMSNYNRFTPAQSIQNYKRPIEFKKDPFSNSINILPVNNHPQCNYQSVKKRKDMSDSNENSTIKLCNDGISSNLELITTIDLKKRKTKKRTLLQTVTKLKQEIETKKPNLNAEKNRDILLDQLQSSNNDVVLQLQSLIHFYKTYVNGLIMTNESTKLNASTRKSIGRLENDFEGNETDSSEDVELCCCKIYQNSTSKYKDESLQIKKDMWDKLLGKFPDITENRFKHLLNMLITEMNHVCFDFSVEDESNKENEYPIDLSIKSSNDRMISDENQSYPAFNFYRSRTHSKSRKRSKTHKIVRI
ncbi:PREDICTED: uncharacterized protein LOC108560520 [Nicrophorus vespilloides]|uniref:Uncharacterized protein LOC108560520 n=1 Tax=Nicrophorus vespilloides TaxID=110193 RepID=A0ABM1MG82_NICVS|nr:PREDICTED: uncharacterized protein LOC108560520 [Nicrophorus vespilloides]